MRIRRRDHQLPLLGHSASSVPSSSRTRAPTHHTTRLRARRDATLVAARGDRGQIAASQLGPPAP
jgi:hypothetical protein